MTDNPTLARSLTAAALVTLATLGATQSAHGQAKAWSPTVRVRLEFRYDNNPFLLTGGRKQRLDDVSSADAQSGLFRDMESSMDLVPAPALELALQGPGLAGRALELSADVAYEANLENSRRRHAELDFTVAQSLRRGGRLRFDVGWRPSYFHKNYLRDAVDLNADGDIGPAERRYEPATSSEVDVWFGYRRRLLKAGLNAELEVGYFDRAYDGPFDARSRHGPGAGIDLSLDLGRRWTIGVEYTLQALSAESAPEVLILDENAFGVDFNGNGTGDDDSARAVVSVDRSRTEHEVGLTFRGELSRRTTLELAYEYRRRGFGSEEPYDVANRDRRDTRNEVTAELDMRLASGLHVTFGGRRSAQTTNRSGDPGSTGDETDYTRYVASAGLRYRF